LPGGSIFILCEPEALEEHAANYAEFVPAGDHFFIDWRSFQDAAARARITTVLFSESSGSETQEALAQPLQSPQPTTTPLFQSLDAYRPIVERAADPQVAEVQRREFFAQLHRWARQGYGVNVFCNNAGERQRFEEIWAEYGFSRVESRESRAGRRSGTFDARPWTLDPHRQIQSRGAGCGARAG
jgi:hypothetical protein